MNVWHDYVAHLNANDIKPNVYRSQNATQKLQSNDPSVRLEC